VKSVVLAAVVGCLLAPAWCPAARGRSAFGYEFGLSTDYDNNVFQYSPRDESLFVHRNAPQRFPFRSLDDMVVNVTGRVWWRPRLIRRHVTQVGLGFAGHEFLSNPVKNHVSVSLRARQYFARGLFVGVNYLLIPGYTIRYYRAPGTSGSYQPCRFTEHLIGIAVGGRLAEWLDAVPFVRYEIDDYLSPFAFYRTTAWRMGIEGTLQPYRQLGIGLNYEFKSASSRHVAPDISYNQHEAGIELEPKFGPVSLGLGGDFTWRGYTASAGVDTTHAERQDLTGGAFGRVAWTLAKGFTLTADVRREGRNSASPYQADIDDVKDYVQWKAGLGVRWGR
jgi:hypothetical protein